MNQLTLLDFLNPDITKLLEGDSFNGSYYNTTKLEGSELREAKKTASLQDQKVLQLFEEGTEMTSHDVEDILKKYPRSSIVRSINTLTKAGLLIKTNKQKIGKYGKLVYLWRLA